MKQLLYLAIPYIASVSFFCKCKSGERFVIIDEIQLNKTERVAIVKNKNGELNLAKVKDQQYDIIQTKRQLEKNANYELDSVQAAGSITIIELFLRQEGVNSSIGFLFCSDYTRSFRCIDVSEIDSVNAEGIEKIKIDSVNNRITVSLYSQSSKRHFASTDFCNSWLVLSKK